LNVLEKKKKNRQNNDRVKDFKNFADCRWCQSSTTVDGHSKENNVTNPSIDIIGDIDSSEQPHILASTYIDIASHNKRWIHNTNRPTSVSCFSVETIFLVPVSIIQLDYFEEY